MNNALVSIGGGRASHAAMIVANAHNWGMYATTHDEAFRNAGLSKYQAVNAEGAVLATNSDSQALLKQLNALNATSLRHEDFLAIQDMITTVRRRSLNGIADLQAGGLTFTANISDQLVGFENINEFQEAEQDMNPNKFQSNDTKFTEDFVPNPITHQSFSVPWRQQGFNYKQSLGTGESVRQVAEKLEDMLFNGNAAISVTFNGTAFPIYGYTTHPTRGTGTISDWTVAANNDLIVTELIAQIGEMWTNQGGVSNDSVMVYVANDIWTLLQKDYKAGFPSKTILDRIKDISQIKDVKAAEKLASTQVVLVEMEARTVQLAVASDIIMVPHTKTNPFESQVITTYAAMVPQIKSDSNNKTGVRHLTVS